MNEKLIEHYTEAELIDAYRDLQDQKKRLEEKQLARRPRVMKTGQLSGFDPKEHAIVEFAEAACNSIVDLGIAIVSQEMERRHRSKIPFYPVTTRVMKWLTSWIQRRLPMDLRLEALTLTAKLMLYLQRAYAEWKEIWKT